jgi:hypothetical protein
MHALASAPIFYLMFRLLLSWAHGLRNGLYASWRSDLIPAGRHCLVLCNTLLPDSGDDRAALLAVASQITAMFAWEADPLNVRSGSAPAGRDRR